MESMAIGKREERFGLLSDNILVDRKKGKVGSDTKSKRNLLDREHRPTDRYVERKLVGREAIEWWAKPVDSYHRAESTERNLRPLNHLTKTMD